ncbi:hypothetical protein [Bacteroides caecimuris]|jgi:hypothetical protein|uniref:hypothetical protein n=1 Tax=Bacteroides caecimuris TaxID=1796613 RepID=UPI0025B17730|nr:hypothetical protein [Bacteroides caecimuris]
MSTITVSVEELNRMIDEKVQMALANTKPVRDSRMKELETIFKNEFESSNLRRTVSWYSIWQTIRTACSMRMGYSSVSKVPPSRYDEVLADIKTEVTAVLEAFKRKEETR